MTTTSQIDLRQLALDRAPDAGSHDASNGKKWFSRYVLPFSILIGFAGLIAYSVGEQLMPATPVKVVPVMVKMSDAQPAGVELFQAAGWIEPRPTAVSVPALAAGIVDQLLVVEGQEVQEGEPIARLITVDAEIAVRQAKAELSRCEGELQRARAELDAAKSMRDTPLHLMLPLAEAQGLLAKVQAETDKLPYRIKAAKSKLNVAKRSLESKRRAGDAVSGSRLRQAEGDYEAAQAELDELSSRAPNLAREIESLQEKVKVLKRQNELQLEDHGRVAEAEGKVVSATALLEKAKLHRQRAELDLERMTVRAPMDGRILNVVATPGTRVMGLEHLSGQSSSTVAEMYDPTKLQIRVDVRLENVPQVVPGSPVEIKTASSSRLVAGRVLRPTSVANIQKNTLEFKVALIDPPAALRPDMLVNATFLSAAIQSDSESSAQKQRIFIPKQLTSGGTGRIAGSEATVWAIDSQNRAVQLPVKLGGIDVDGLIEVVTGLNVTDKLIASDPSVLTVGQKIKIVGEESTIGAGR